MGSKLTISKLDAAKRQIETVIRLYFSNGDPVSIHTLAAASYNVLKDLNKKRGGMKLIVKEQFLDVVKEERLKEVRDRLNAAENFFKHADRDHAATLDFNPDLTELLLFEACSVYFRLSGEYPPLLRVFQGWFMANNQDLFNLPEEQENTIAVVGPDVVRLGREGYFSKILPLIMKLGT